MGNSLIARLQNQTSGPKVQTSSFAKQKERLRQATTPCATINLPINCKKSKPNTSELIKPVSKTVESCSSDSLSKSSGGKPKQNKMDLMKSADDQRECARSQGWFE